MSPVDGWTVDGRTAVFLPAASAIHYLKEVGP
jgi:hypothetical protein